MITTILIGGLGNQMFQYAAGRALAEKHRTSPQMYVLLAARYRLHPFDVRKVVSDYPPTPLRRLWPRTGFDEMPPCRHAASRATVYFPTTCHGPDATCRRREKRITWTSTGRRKAMKTCACNGSRCACHPGRGPRRRFRRWKNFRRAFSPGGARSISRSRGATRMSTTSSASPRRYSPPRSPTSRWRAASWR